jgi:hypothetical protein
MRAFARVWTSIFMTIPYILSRRYSIPCHTATTRRKPSGPTRHEIGHLGADVRNGYAASYWCMTASSSSESQAFGFFNHSEGIWGRKCRRASAARAASTLCADAGRSSLPRHSRRHLLQASHRGRAVAGPAIVHMTFGAPSARLSHCVFSRKMIPYE